MLGGNSSPVPEVAGGITPTVKEEEGKDRFEGDILGAVLALFRDNPKAAKALTGVAGSLIASELNKPSSADREAQAGLNRAANAQASDVEANVRRKNELEALVKGLEPLTGDQKNDLIRLRPGKQTDFSNVRGTGDVALMMQLAGLGAPSGLVGQAGALANQNDLFGQQQTGNTVASLVELLLGLGQGGQPAGPSAFPNLSGINPFG